MKRAIGLAVGVFCVFPTVALRAQQDPGPVFRKMPVDPPAKAAIPPKLDAPYALVKLSVDESGAAQDVSVIRSGGDALDAKAVEAVRANNFPQRTQNGSAMKYPLQVAVTMPGGDSVAQIHTVNHAVVLFAPPPEFSEESRRKKIAGNVLVGLEVDEKGRPQKVHIVKGTGYGLDEKAMECVRKYRFNPATVEGKAIAVPMNVEVNFQVF